MSLPVVLIKFLIHKNKFKNIFKNFDLFACHVTPAAKSLYSSVGALGPVLVVAYGTYDLSENRPFI